MRAAAFFLTLFSVFRFFFSCNLILVCFFYFGVQREESGTLMAKARERKGKARAGKGRHKAGSDGGVGERASWDGGGPEPETEPEPGILYYITKSFSFLCPFFLFLTQRTVASLVMVLSVLGSRLSFFCFPAASRDIYIHTAH